MKFNYFGKTRAILAIVMIVLMVAYLASMTGSFIKYEQHDYRETETGELYYDENGLPEEIVRDIDVSQLSYLWFPSAHSSVLSSELAAYFDNEYEYNINDTATTPVLLFILGIVTAILAFVSLFRKKKILWTWFALVWGLIGVYCYIANPIMKAALSGEVACVAVAQQLVMIQMIIAFVGCAVAIAAFVISNYADKKNNKMLMASILKREEN